MRHSSSPASSAGTSARVPPGPNDSVAPSHPTLASGVTIDQRMVAKRFTKKGAVSSRMWCSGSNQAT